jgi:hypothetical protein
MILLGFADSPRPERPEEPGGPEQSVDPEQSHPDDALEADNSEASKFSDPEPVGEDSAEDPVDAIDRPNEPVEDPDEVASTGLANLQARKDQPTEAEPEEEAAFENPDAADPNQPIEDQQAAEAAALHEHTVADEVNDTLAKLIPWGVSLLLHAGLVLVAIFIVWSVQQVIDEEEVIIPIVSLSETPGVPLQVTVQERVETTTSQQSPNPNPNPNPSTSVSTNVSVDVSLAGLGQPVGGAPAFGVDVGDAAAFETTFMGSGGNAKNIVFVIDASGTMVDTLPFVVDELKTTIRDLSEKQRFAVVFTRDLSAQGIRPDPMQQASSNAKSRVLGWLEEHKYRFALGNDDVVGAIRKALQNKPDLIFLLSDDITGVGEYSVDQRKLLEEIDRANVKRTKINTIQFLYPDPLERIGGKGTLQIIAENTGGVYTFLDAKSLGLPGQ